MQYLARSLICSKRASRLVALSFLESFSPSGMSSGFSAVSDQRGLEREIWCHGPFKHRPAGKGKEKGGDLRGHPRL